MSFFGLHGIFDGSSSSSSSSSRRFMSRSFVSGAFDPRSADGLARDGGNNDDGGGESTSDGGNGGAGTAGSTGGDADAVLIVPPGGQEDEEGEGRARADSSVGTNRFRDDEAASSRVFGRDDGDCDDGDDSRGGITILPSVKSGEDEIPVVVAARAAGPAPPSSLRIYAVSPIARPIRRYGDDGDDDDYNADALSISTSDSRYTEVDNSYLFDAGGGGGVASEGRDGGRRTPREIPATSSSSSCYSSPFVSPPLSSSSVSLSLHPSSVPSSVVASGYGFSSSAASSSSSAASSSRISRTIRSMEDFRTSHDDRDLRPLFRDVMDHLSRNPPAMPPTPSAEADDIDRSLPSETIPERRRVTGRDPDGDKGFWYSKFQTDRDWEDFLDRAIRLIAASGDHVECVDAALAELIQREEEIFWNDIDGGGDPPARSSSLVAAIGKRKHIIVLTIGGAAAILASSTLPLFAAAALMARKRGQ